MTVTQIGHKKRISTSMAMLLRLTEKALSGNIQAFRLWVDLIRDYDEDEVDSIAKSMSADDASIMKLFVDKIRRQDRDPTTDEEVDEALDAEEEDE